MSKIKKNIVIIMADQLRFDFITPEITPNIWDIKAESVVFNSAYCASPLCAPARGAFFTGRYPNENGSLINPWEPLEKVHGDVRSGLSDMYPVLQYCFLSNNPRTLYRYYSI